MSNTKLKSVEFSINEVVKLSSYRSYASKNDMKVMLKRCASDLHSLGFKIGHIKGFKAKHIYALVQHWKSHNKSPATIKNYLSKLRELANILGDKQLVKRDNQAYNIGSRKYFSETNKAIHQIDFSKCTDPLVRLSMEGQYLFGLRREEAIKFTVSEALKTEGHIRLESSWTKGGIGRLIPITNQAQRDWLMRVIAAVEPGQALIHKGCSYKEQLNKYAYQTKLMGVGNLHGLRHGYAQRRYKALTTYYDPDKKGWECPFNGGVRVKDMDSSKQDIDFKVRHILTRELGHSRLSVLKSYLN